MDPRAGQYLNLVFPPQSHRDTEKPNCLASPSGSGLYRFELFLCDSVTSCEKKHIGTLP